MWVFTQDGFYSAVQHREEPFYVMVRGRDEESLQRLAAALDLPADAVFTDWPSDYPYRIELHKDQWSDFLTTAVRDLDYENFKDRLRTSRGKPFANVAGDVWLVLHKLTPPKVTKAMDKMWEKLYREIRFNAAR
jgi:hypothetical protein